MIVNKNGLFSSDYTFALSFVRILRSFFNMALLSGLVWWWLDFSCVYIFSVLWLDGFCFGVGVILDLRVFVALSI